MKPETKFKEKVYRALDNIGAINGGLYYEKIQQLGIRGTPDIIGCYHGTHFTFELKVDAPVDALQNYKLMKYKKAGSYAVVVTPANLDAVIAGLVNGHRVV